MVITHEDLGGGEGHATLYLDGVAQSSTAAVGEPFGWDWATASIRVGVNYVGLFDELAIFDRALTADEIASLASLEGGVSDLWRR